jgi:hypothetical protein
VSSPSTATVTIESDEVVASVIPDLNKKVFYKNFYDN